MVSHFRGKLDTIEATDIKNLRPKGEVLIGPWKGLVHIRTRERARARERTISRSEDSSSIRRISGKRDSELFSTARLLVHVYRHGIEAKPMISEHP